MTIAEENAKRNAQGKLPMSPEEERAFAAQLETANQAEDNLSTIGSIRTDTKHGSRVVSGPFKGMHPTEAKQAALKGGVVKPTRAARQTSFHSGPLTAGGGLDGLYAMNPHLNPRRQAPAPMFPPADQTSASPPRIHKPTFAAGAGAMALPAVASLAVQGVNTANQRAADAGAAGMAKGLQDAKQGVRERGPGGVTWNNGATVFPAGGNRSGLVSPYGGGSSVMLPRAQVTGDPNLRAEIAAINERQSKGIFDPRVPALMKPTGPAGSPPPPQMLASAPVTAAPPVQSGMPQVPAASAPRTALTKPTPPATQPAPMVDNLSPAGRSAIINQAVASIPPPQPMGPLTQVDRPGAGTRFAQAQRSLDVAAATPGPLAIAQGLGSIASDVQKGAQVLTGAASDAYTASSASQWGTVDKVRNWITGDPSAKSRLNKGVVKPANPMTPPILGSR